MQLGVMLMFTTADRCAPQPGEIGRVIVEREFGGRRHCGFVTGVSGVGYLAVAGPRPVVAHCNPIGRRARESSGCGQRDIYSHQNLQSETGIKSFRRRYSAAEGAHSTLSPGFI